MGKGSRSGLEDKKDKKVLVYAQNSLQAIDNAPEPSTSSSVGRHAVSAADLLSSSMSAVSSSEGGARADFKSAPRSASFTLLQGSASSLRNLKAGGTTQVRASFTAVSNPNTSSNASSAASPRLADVGREGSEKVMKRSIYGPKDLDGIATSVQGLTVEESDRSAGGSEPGSNSNRKSNDASSDSSDSYDASAPAMLGPGMDESEISLNLRKLGRQTSSLSKQGYTMGSVATNESDDDYDDEYNQSISTMEEEDGPVTCCGFHAPQCRLPVNRVATCTVRYAPCFWCFPIPISATDRTVLTRLNIISAFLAIGQIVSASWLIIVMLIPSEHEQQDDQYGYTHGMAPNLWTLTGSMYSIGFFGGLILATALATLKIIQVVNLVGAIRYLWVLLYLIPFEIFFVLSIMDFYNVTQVWIKHWWLVPSMSWFRDTYCAPGTAGTLCMAPVVNGTDWCIEEYNATNCTQIRDDAQGEVLDLMTWFYNSNVGWGCLLIVMLLLIVNTLERIISRPMVQKSRESNVPAWLSLPFLGSSVVGAVFRYSPSSVLSEQSDSTYDYSWIGTAYIACGILFMISAALGWFISTFSILSGRDKRYKHLCVMVFIFLMGVTSFILTVIFAASVAYSVAWVEVPIDPFQKDSIACGVDTADSCSNCDEDAGGPFCPEWTLDDVVRVLQTQTKGSATLAVIFFGYSFSALRFGFVLRKHVTMYQIEYV